MFNGGLLPRDIDPERPFTIKVTGPDERAVIVAMEKVRRQLRQLLPLHLIRCQEHAVFGEAEIHVFPPRWAREMVSRELSRAVVVPAAAFVADALARMAESNGRR